MIPEFTDDTYRTPTYAFPYLMPAQAQKHVTVNESLTRLDALLHPSVIGVAALPPSNPAERDLWLLDENAGGSWVDQDNCLAQFIAES